MGRLAHAGILPGRLRALARSQWGASVLARGLSSSTEDQKIKVQLHDFKAHRLDPPPAEATTTGSELLGFFRTMFTMRRMELTADLLYKQKLARGFLHLADGQEAVPVARSPAALRASVPNGAGIALAHKYRKEPHVAVSIYGDGAANQGQIAEAYNLAAIWSLPIIFVVENNHFGMGTSESRAAKSHDFYRRGDYVPGLWVDGMDALAVKQATAFAKRFALENGPIVLEMDTYRYHGHSISDPGVSYRTRDEVQGVRRARDPIERIRRLLLDHDIIDAEGLKRIEKDVRKEIERALEAAKAAPEPPLEALAANIYVDSCGARLLPRNPAAEPKLQP